MKSSDPRSSDLLKLALLLLAGLTPDQLSEEADPAAGDGRDAAFSC